MCKNICKKIGEFLCQPSQPLFNRVVHIFSLVVFVLAGLIFCYHLGESIYFTLSFPNGSTLEGAVWMVQINLLFLFLWMPAIIFYRKFQKTICVAIVIYIIGCVFAIILSIVAIAIMDGYLKPGAVRDEYQNLVTKCIKENNKLPKAVLFTVDSEECCGWKGAIDFGASFKISDKVKTDFQFMKELEKCYGKTWKVHKSQGTLVYEDGAKSSEAMPKGCNMFYKKLFQRNCLLVFYFGLLIIILGLVFIVLSVLLCKSFKKRTESVSASESEAATEDKTLSKTEVSNNAEVPPSPTKSKKGENSKTSSKSTKAEDSKSKNRYSVEPEDPERSRIFSI